MLMFWLDNFRKSFSIIIYFCRNSFFSKSFDFMALLHSFEKSGNFLFKHRGQLPLILFIVVIPVIIFTDYSKFSEKSVLFMTIFSIMVCFTGFIIRSIAIGTTPKGTSGRNTQNQVADSLNSKGIYSVVRHPLYLGNYLMWIGIVIFTFNLYFVVIISLAFWLYYERIMFAEERFLERKFGEVYISWASNLPAFIPNFRLYSKGNIRFSLKSVLRREYSGMLAAVAGFVFIDHVRNFVIHNEFDPNRLSSFALIFFGILALFLRTLKHHSGLLNEDGRS
jgi:protein-S-isoprenylcysteine O-methyltransferase Ste14